MLWIHRSERIRLRGTSDHSVFGVEKEVWPVRRRFPQPPPHLSLALPIDEIPPWGVAGLVDKCCVAYEMIQHLSWSLLPFSRRRPSTSWWMLCHSELSRRDRLTPAGDLLGNDLVPIAGLAGGPSSPTALDAEPAFAFAGGADLDLVRHLTTSSCTICRSGAGLAPNSSTVGL